MGLSETTASDVLVVMVGGGALRACRQVASCVTARRTWSKRAKSSASKRALRVCMREASEGGLHWAGDASESGLVGSDGEDERVFQGVASRNTGVVRRDMVCL